MTLFTNSAGSMAEESDDDDSEADDEMDHEQMELLGRGRIEVRPFKVNTTKFVLVDK